MRFPFSHIVVTCPSRDKEECYLEEMASIPDLEACEVLVCSDPHGVRIGSGGGTLNALDRLRSHVGDGLIQVAKVLIVHSGGDSRRAPLHSVCGKAWASINGAVMASPISLLVGEIGAYFEKRDLQEGSVVVASSDVLLALNSPSNTTTVAKIPQNAISVIAVPEVPSIAKNHGVLVHDSTIQPSSEVDSTIVARAVRYLQKPSIDEMEQSGAINMMGRSLIDTGLVCCTGMAYKGWLCLLDDPLISRCTERVLTAEEPNRPCALRLELYSDMLLAAALKDGTVTLAEYSRRLGLSGVEEVSPSERGEGTSLTITPREQQRAALVELWRALSPFPLYVVECCEGAFCHLGTSQELLDLVTFASRSTGTEDSEGSFLDRKYRRFCQQYGLQANCGSVMLDLQHNAVGGCVSINSVEQAVALGDGGRHAGERVCSLVEHSTLMWPRVRAVNSITSHVNSLLGALGGGMGTLKNARAGITLQQVPLAGTAPAHAERDHCPWAVSVLGIQDPIKLRHNCPSGQARVCGAPWRAFFAATGWSAGDVWASPEDEAEGLWTARLFCEAKPAQVWRAGAGAEERVLVTGMCHLSVGGEGPLESVVALTWMQHLRAVEAYLVNKGGSSGSGGVACEELASLLYSECYSSAGTAAGEAGSREHVLTALLRGLRAYRDTPIGRRLSLRDLLERGDALHMHRWRRLLACVMGPLLGPLSVAAGRVACGESGGEGEGTAGARRDELVGGLPFLLGAYAKCVDAAGSSNSNAALLLLWMARLCLGPAGDSPIDGRERALLAVAVAVAERHHRGGTSAVDGEDINQTGGGTDRGGGSRGAPLELLEAFGGLWADLTACCGPRRSDLSLAALLFLRRQARVDGAGGGGEDGAVRGDTSGAAAVRLSLALALLGALSPHVEPSAHPRLLLLCAWLLRRNGRDGSSASDAASVPPAIAVLSSARRSISEHAHRGFEVGFPVCATVASQLAVLAHTHGDMREKCAAAATQVEAVAQALVGAHVSHSLRLHMHTTVSDRETSIPPPTPPPPAASAGAAAGRWVVAQAPVRLDIAGGWSDTPPVCYESPAGGCVLNVGVCVDGKRPIACCCRFIESPVLLLRSMHVQGQGQGQGLLEGEEEKVTHVGAFAAMRDPTAGDPHALLKACCVVLGIVPSSAGAETDEAGKEGRGDLTGLLQAGIEVACVSDLPAGSGLGGSSILAMTVVAALHRLLASRDGSSAGPGEGECGKLSASQLVYYTCLVEQLLTTGGGWQDQCGALPGGFKLGRSAGGLPLAVGVKEVLPAHTEAFLACLHARCFLVYTGVTRLARNTLINALRGFASVPLEGVGGASEPSSRGTVQRLVDCAEAAAAELECADASVSPSRRVDCLARRLSEYWALKVEMAEGSEPPHITRLLEFLRPHCSGLSLCGAGAGGFAVVVLKEGEGDGKGGGYAFLKGLVAGYSSSMSVHRMRVDPIGLSTNSRELAAGDAVAVLTHCLEREEE